MSDPNYMHEFHPNHKGKCQMVVSGRYCALPKSAEVHKRFKRHQTIQEILDSAQSVRASVAENGRFLTIDSPWAKFGKVCAAAIRALPASPKENKCTHERLSEDGICRSCGQDRRGI